MPCPRCSSHDLWDDNAAWGCHECGWATYDGSVQNTDARNDRFDNRPERWDEERRKRIKRYSDDRER